MKRSLSNQDKSTHIANRVPQVYTSSKHTHQKFMTHTALWCARVPQTLQHLTHCIEAPERVQGGFNRRGDNFLLRERITRRRYTM